MRKPGPFYRDPRIQIFLVLILGFLFYIFLTIRAGQWVSTLDILKAGLFTLTMQFDRIPRNVILLAIDGVLFLLGFLLWMAFFSQFMLPLQSLRDRYRAMDRLSVYLVGEHGQAVFIEDGKPHERRGESRRKGPGIMILDTASAAVLRSDFAFTRTVGPGVVFTNKNEYLGKAVDLHTQAARLGPAEREDPFRSQDLENEPLEEYQKRQERRRQTSGLTRDGVEVVPTVVVAYRLKRPPGDNSPSFGYYPLSVQQWATADGPLASSASDKSWDNIPLHDLPANIAVDVWREYLQRFTISELFTSPILELERGETAYSTISKMLRARLTQPMVRDLDVEGKPTGHKTVSREFITLRERGIQVLGVSVFNLRFDQAVETRLVQQWVATWMRQAQAERGLVERRRSREILLGRWDASVRFAAAAASRFDADVLALPKPSNDNEELIQMRIALERLVEGTLNESISNPQFIQLLQAEEANLRDLLAWIGEQVP
jgi:hypothetical protein